MKHELVVLADKIDWAWLDDALAACFSDQGRPAESVRFMIGMFLLKHTYALSDEQVWVDLPGKSGGTFGILNVSGGPNERTETTHIYG